MALGSLTPLRRELAKAPEEPAGAGDLEGTSAEALGMLPPHVPTVRRTRGLRCGAAPLAAAAALALAGAVALAGLRGGGAAPSAVHAAAGPPATGGDDAVGDEVLRYEEEKEKEGGGPVTSTTTWTSTTSKPFPNSTKDLPSLFCWLVSQTVGGKKVNKMYGWMEEKLIWEMLMEKVGIFACNDFAVFTDRRCIVSEMAVWGWPYVDADYKPKEGEILSWAMGSTDTARNGDSSPSNSWVFTAAWKALGKSGVLEKHNWVVKQDPDAVFFPHRLRWHTSQYPTKDGETPVFITNCPTFGSMQGPLEVFSISLVRKMIPQIDNCGQGTPGEDSKMKACAQQFGTSYMDSNMLVDKYCMHTEPNCWDGSKVAFHPFKSIPDFRKCVAASMAKEEEWANKNQR